MSPLIDRIVPRRVAADHRASCLAIVASATLAQAALGQTFLATSGRTLYRVEPGQAAASFALSDEITALARTDDGRVWATSPTPGPAGFELYLLGGWAGPDPRLRMVTDRLPANLSALAPDGSVMLAFDGYSDRVYTLDPSQAGSALLRGHTLAEAHGAGGAARDPESDRIYLLHNVTDAVRVIDPAGLSAGSPTAELLAPLSVDAIYSDLSVAGGVIYAAVDLGPGRGLEVGTLDPRTGAFVTISIVDAAATGGSVGLAVVPTPGGAALTALAAVLARTRRGRPM